MKYEDFKAQHDALDAEETAAYQARREAYDGRRSALAQQVMRSYRPVGAPAPTLGGYERGVAMSGDGHVTLHFSYSQVPADLVSPAYLRWMADALELIERWKRGEIQDLPTSGELELVAGDADLEALHNLIWDLGPAVMPDGPRSIAAAAFRLGARPPLPPKAE